MNITFKGKPLTLLGTPLQGGEKLPPCTLTDSELRPVRGEELKSPAVLLTVPSLDTGVCDEEVRRFNEKAAALPGAQVYAVSMDLPFAQARWCAAAGIEQVQTLSDYRERSFGKASGTLIEELMLLTRAVFLLDREGKIAYTEYVPEVTDHPDYERIYGELEKLL